MPNLPTVTVANPGKLIVKSSFNGYDLCLNSFVGCSFGCLYCYVRYFVKDDKLPWGEFVRIRHHITEKLPQELAKGYFELDSGKYKISDKINKKTGKPQRIRLKTILPITEARLVLGTMTDCYQPLEKKHQITHEALNIILKNPLQFKKVGIFTRSPLVLRDIDLIKQLPNGRVHFTITPYPAEVMRALEPYSPLTSRRWKVIDQLVAAGIRVHVNVAPIMPIISDGFIEEFAKRLSNSGVSEYFIDPMQTYSDSYASFLNTCKTIPGVDYVGIDRIMSNKERFGEWKLAFFESWLHELSKYDTSHQLPIWSDHVNKVWVDMNTGQNINRRTYSEA